MEYRILTNDLFKNNEGNYELFLHIEINDGKEIWNKAARLSASEVARVVADPKAIEDVALEMANRAVISRPQEKLDDENNRQIQLAQLALDTAQENTKQEQIKLETAQEVTKAEQIKLQAVQISAGIKVDVPKEPVVEGLIE